MKSKEFYRCENYRQERLEEWRWYEQFSEHENCVKLYQACEQEERLFLQMELRKGSRKLCQARCQDYAAIHSTGHDVVCNAKSSIE